MGPVVFVIGSTAVGKSKLGVELSLRFGGEVLSADSMQIYGKRRGEEGKDGGRDSEEFWIGTAKVTEEEKRGVPHHMLDVADPYETASPYSVKHFQEECLEKIKEIQRRGKVPVVVGGTQLYVQSLLFKDFLDKEEPAAEGRKKELRARLEGLSKDFCFAALKDLDPQAAEKFHAHDSRRILRILERKIVEDPRVEELVAAGEGGGGEAKRRRAQASDPETAVNGEDASTNRELRFPEALVFWLDCVDFQGKLAPRIEKRIGKMVEEGLVEELRRVREGLKGEGEKRLQWGKGILQGIGYKEFMEWIEMDEKSPEADAVFKECVSLLGKNTKRYAKQQRQWIKNKFVLKKFKGGIQGGVRGERGPESKDGSEVCGNGKGVSLNVYRLDTSQYEEGGWDRSVLAVAEEIFLSTYSDSQARVERPRAREGWANGRETGAEGGCAGEDLEGEEGWKKLFCDKCEKEVNGPYEWRQHIKSKGHRNKKKHKRILGASEVKE